MNSSSSLYVHEIFYSLQGESTRMGCPTFFIRLTGCNLRCSYCDTQEAYQKGQWMTGADITQNLSLEKTPYVCVTGGEPLQQKEALLPFLHHLCQKSYLVSLETNGSLSCQDIDHRVKILLDVKTPSSQEAPSFYLQNLDIVPPSTEIKFVIGSTEDFDWAESFCKKNKLFQKFTVLYSPCAPHVTAPWLAEKILTSFSSARLQVQLHKTLWPHAKGGV